MVGSGGAGWLWRRLGAAALVALPLVPGAAPAVEPNPFLPPTERADEIEARLQKRIDLAVAAVEERLVKAVVDALNGRDTANVPKPVQDAVARRAASAAPSASGNTSLPPGLPGLPPLPSFPGGAGQGGTSGGSPAGPVAGLASATPDPVPSGAVFIGCLDGKAFFQDRAGSPFLVDPRVFPQSSGGAGACGR